ncbi:MAG: sulfite exporter TauE/SafE family protein [Steroidobacteraceae bacterium]|nr:sulfite exporter TauE/SafE family protein [Steroidobacteraceae bacterium]
MTAVSWEVVAAAAALGLGGNVHCLAMCGGIAAAAGTRLPAGAPGTSPVAAALAFNVGRLTAYALLGIVIGALAGGLLGMLPTGFDAKFLRLAAALLMAILGLQLLLRRDLLGLERIGSVFWRRIQPLAGGALRLPGIWRSLALGAAWGFLPCGLVYSALALAATAGSGPGAGLAMLAFGAATLPSMVGAALSGAMLSRWLARPGARVAAGILLIGFAAWTAAMPLAGHRGHGAAAPAAGEHAGHAMPAADPQPQHQHQH